MKLDKYRKELNGITVQDYKSFLNEVPALDHDKDMKEDYYQKFKSYTNALAPFSGLDLANEHGISLLDNQFRKKDIRVPSSVQQHKSAREKA